MSIGRALGLFVLLAACVHAPAPVAQTAGDASAGRRLAEVNCSTCHAIGAAGDSRHAMAPPFRTLSRSYPVESLSEAFAEGVLVGHRDMPEFQLEPSQIDDLLAYIQSIQEERAS